MKYFERTQVSTSQRPIPQQGESFIIQQGNVGLYERKDKLDQYQDGVCYLTTHRIIYVDSTKATERAVALPLSMVKDIETFNGFLRASPKIIVHLQAADRSTSSSIITSTATTLPSSLQQSWVCTICSFSNPPTTVEKCQLCGVRRPQDTPSTTATDTSDQQQKDSSACRVCTFLNHPSMIQCEMCGASLANPTLSNHSSISDMLHTSQQQQQQPLEDDAHVRIAFRNGGLSGFVSKLKEAVDVKAWNNKPVESPIEKPASPITRGVGISAIQGRIEKSTMEAQESMDEAFQDLDKLMAKATEMVSLAESISTKMNKESSNDGDDLSALRTTLLNLGISDPVTRGSAGSIYHQELARELADFLSKFLDEQDTMKPLTDLYCVFNRARGVAFISPEDLYKAAMQFEVLQLPFRMRQFPSGLLVVQSLYMDDERAAQRVLDRIKEQGGHITSLRLAELENYALAVATEHLMIAEQKALVCRDQGPNGLTFYENLLLTS